MPHILTPGARRHIALMSRALEPFAARIDRHTQTLLRRLGHDPERRRELVAIAPHVLCRIRPLNRLIEQVQYHGRRLANLNVTPEEVHEARTRIAEPLDAVLDGRFEPAREQLQLATTLALDRAYYAVRESEARAFFELSLAEIEAKGVNDLLRRSTGILRQALRARSGRLLSKEEAAGGSQGGSWWSYPVAEDVVMQFGFRAAYSPMPRELALIEAAGARCREAIERARLREEIRRLEALARTAEMEERKRIGRELHDESGQSMLLLRLQLEMLEHEAPDWMKPRLAAAREIAERNIVELRRIVAALSPAVLERLGLEPALRRLSERMQTAHRAAYRVRIALPPEPLPMPLQEVIYRVAQESLQNVVKHSGATHVNLSLHTADKKLKLSVSDNGAGFNSEQTAKPLSFGLAGMRERAALLGGTLVVQSAVGNGTKVTLRLPSSLTGAQHVKDTYSIS